METREIAVLVAKALDAKRAKDIVVLNVGETTVITVCLLSELRFLSLDFSIRRAFSSPKL